MWRVNSNGYQLWRWRFGRVVKLAVDFSAENTKVIVDGQLVFNEIPLVCLSSFNQQLVAVGKKAQSFSEARVNNVQLCLPVVNGLPSDLEALSQFLKNMINEGTQNNFLFTRYKVALSFATDINQSEKAAVYQVCRQVGLGNVVIVPRLLAANAQYEQKHERQPLAKKIIFFIGQYSCEIGMIEANKLVWQQRINWGYEELFNGLRRFLSEHFQIEISIQIARELLENYPDVSMLKPEDSKNNKQLTISIKGKDSRTHGMKTCLVDTIALYDHLSGSINNLASQIELAWLDLNEWQNQASEDQTIWLSGKFISFPGISSIIQISTGAKTMATRQPELDVVKGLWQLISK